MAEKESKFGAMITASDKSIKQARAVIIVKAGRRAAENKVRSIEDEVDSLETTILNLTDLAPDTSFSLKPGKDFDAESWVNKLHEATLDLELKKIELAAAEAIVTEWF